MSQPCRRTNQNTARPLKLPRPTYRESPFQAPLRKESDSSNNYGPITIGPLTTNQDLENERGEKIYNLPLMIQQPFLREKKEPIKVDISVKLIPKPRKKIRKDGK